MELTPFFFATQCFFLMHYIFHFFCRLCKLRSCAIGDCFVAKQLVRTCTRSCVHMFGENKWPEVGADFPSFGRLVDEGTYPPWLHTDFLNTNVPFTCDGKRCLRIRATWGKGGNLRTLQHQVGGILRYLHVHHTSHHRVKQKSRNIWIYIYIEH